ncbi:MAG: universal stress protein [Geminicoccaceae bacterium]|nr:universal stress protein [Geminicoccaceae bacterium]
MTDDVQPAILHPTDLSPAGEKAFHLALKLALARRTRFYILHIDPEVPETVDWDAFPSVRATLERWQLLEAGSPPEAVASKLGVGVRKVDVVGREPVGAIADFVDTHLIGMIVLATRGREGLDRWLKGQIAEPLARRANLPTLFLPYESRPLIDPADGSARLERILVPIDAKPRPEAAVREAQQVGAALGCPQATIELLHVGAPGEAPAVQIPDDLDARVETATREGWPVDAILERAASDEIGLIAMATEGRRGFLDALRGSTTEQVVRRAPCPVLAVPA